MNDNIEEEESSNSDSDEKYDDATEMPPEGLLETIFEQPSEININVNYAGDSLIAGPSSKDEKSIVKFKDEKISKNTPTYNHQRYIDDLTEKRSMRCELCKYFYVIGNETLIVHAHEPWPKDVKLYQPYEVEQILLPDNANCLAVKAFLKMCNLDFEVVHRPNAEFMSPTGKVPFIRCGAFVVAELEGIVSFVAQKGISLTEDLEPDQRADMRAYMALINNVLGNAESYVCWCDNETYSEITKPRNGSVYPWPLNLLQTWSKRSKQIKHLKTLGWYEKSLKEVFLEVETCCKALTDRLEDNTYFFGDKFTELDALLYGHIYSLLTTPLPAGCNSLGFLLKRHQKLVNLIKKVDKDVMGRHTEFVIEEWIKIPKFSLFGKRTITKDEDIDETYMEPVTGRSVSTTVAVDTSDQVLSEFSRSHTLQTNSPNNTKVTRSVKFCKDGECTSEQFRDDTLFDSTIMEFGDKDGDWPTELDALVFGHLYTILTTPLPSNELAITVRNFPSLINLVGKVEKYFKRESSDRER